TTYSGPRYLLIVLALAGDSTMTSCLPFALAAPAPPLFFAVPPRVPTAFFFVLAARVRDELVLAMELGNCQTIITGRSWRIGSRTAGNQSDECESGGYGFPRGFPGLPGFW